MAVEFDLEDLERRYPGDLDMFEQEYVEQQIEDVVAVIEVESPGVQARISSGVLSATLYKRVVADVVNRVLLNPFGRTNESEGGFAAGRDSRVAAGLIEITAVDRARLRGTPVTASVVGTVRLGVYQ